MRKPIYFSELSPAKQTLLRLCQLVNFGRIEDLEFRDGQPVFSPPPRFLFDLKLNAECGPRPEFRKDNYALREEAVRLFEYLARINSGTIEALDIRDGIPFRALFDATPIEVEP